MKMLLSAAIFACCIAAISCSAKQEKPVQTTDQAGSTRPTFELYSWQDPAGDWCFNLLSSISSYYTAEHIFDEALAIHGLDQLRQSISELPAGSYVIWFPSVIIRGNIEKGTEALRLPPKEIIDEIKRYATERDVDIVCPEPKPRSQ